MVLDSGAMSEFSGKVALVTGAASGIGAAVAARLVGLGAEVYCGDLNQRDPFNT